MMPGIGFTEMILLVVVAIVVIGPKDLPLMMRKFGKFTGKMRALAFEFQQGIDELGRQAELEELRKEVAELKKSTGLEDLREDLNKDRADLEESMRALPSPGEAPAGTPAPGALSPEQMEESRLLAESASGAPTDPASVPPSDVEPSTATQIADALPDVSADAHHYDYPGAEDHRPPSDDGVDIIPDDHVRHPAKQDTPA